MTEFDGLHSMHPAPPRPDAAAVRWLPSERRANCIRVRAYTCECSPLVFEQCVSAGLGFVRRYDRSVSPVTVVESPWVRVADAEALWRRIMDGQAR
ncbi:hypothetical protein GCM10020216_095250 [Nonomuraea helvata]